MIVLMLLAGLGFLLCGIFLPFTSVTKLWIFENQVSVFQGLVSPFKESEIFLFLILFVFTVCFPILKITALLALYGCIRDLRPIRPSLSLNSSHTHGQMVHAGCFRGRDLSVNGQIWWRSEHQGAKRFLPVFPLSNADSICLFVDREDRLKSGAIGDSANSSYFDQTSTFTTEDTIRKLKNHHL